MSIIFNDELEDFVKLRIGMSMLNLSAELLKKSQEIRTEKTADSESVISNGIRIGRALTFAEISNIIADIAHIGANHNGK